MISDIDTRMMVSLTKKLSNILPSKSDPDEDAAESLLSTCIEKDSSPMEYINGYIYRTVENPDGVLVTAYMAEAVRQALVYLHADCGIKS